MEKTKIRRAIYSWGIFPALVILKEEQEKENYENCKVIKEALDDVIEFGDLHLNTKIDNISLKKTYEEIIKEFKKPEIIDGNIPYYIEEFRKYIN
jgi:uncharacterized protein YaaR (DUF327 family)